MLAGNSLNSFLNPNSEENSTLVPDQVLLPGLIILLFLFRGVVADPEECEVEELTELSSLEEDLEGAVQNIF